MTGLHALSGCAGSYIALERGNFVRPPSIPPLLLPPDLEASELTRKNVFCCVAWDAKTPARLAPSDNIKLAAFSVLYT